MFTFGTETRYHKVMSLSNGLQAVSVSCTGPDGGGPGGAVLHGVVPRPRAVPPAQRLQAGLQVSLSTACSRLCVDSVELFALSQDGRVGHGLSALRLVV